jgi:hypothetical protein
VTLAALIALFLCASVWFLTSNGQRRVYGALFGLTDAVLWIVAGATAQTWIVVAVAGFCALCFARFLFLPFRSPKLQRGPYAN